MKDIIRSEINKPEAPHNHDALMQYGGQLHCEAVSRGILKILELFRPNTRKTVHLEAKQNTLKYSH